MIYNKEGNIKYILMFIGFLSICSILAININSLNSNPDDNFNNEIFFLKKSAPNVTILTPSDGATFDLPASFDINATLEGTILEAKAMMVNTTASFNISMTLIAGKWTCTWANTSSYDPNYYNITIWARDTLGINQTQSIVVRLRDIDAPSVTGITPTAITNFDVPTTIEINATVSDIPSSSLTVMAMIVNGSNPFNLSMTLIAGEWTCDWTNTSSYDPNYYNITIWAQDESGNVNQTEYTIIQLSDIDAPSVTGITPTAITNFNVPETIEINATVSDIPSSSLTVMAMIVNGSNPFNLSMALIAGEWTGDWTNTSSYDPNYYNITIWAQDESGNVNQTEYTIIQLSDIDAPSVTGITPTAITNFDVPTTIEINATVSDIPSSSLTVMAMIVNGSNPFNLSMTLIAGEWTCDWTNTSSYDPNYYNITIWAQDESGNVNQTEYTIVQLSDIDAPSVSSITPTAITNFDVPTTIEINATVSDIPSSSLTVMAMIVNGSNPFNLSMTLIAGEWTCDWTNTSSYNPNYYNITIWAQDESGNVNQTEYTIVQLSDIDAPSVTGITPTAITNFDVPTTIEINATVSDIPSSSLTVMAMIVNGSNPFNLSMTLIAGEWTCDWTNTSSYDPNYYNITIWAQDESGNVNQTEYTILQLSDIDAPSVTGITPTAITNFDVPAIIEINATVSDIPSSSLTVMAMIVNGSNPFNLSMTLIAGEWTCDWTNTSSYDPNYYNITIWAQDESGNVNQTEYTIVQLSDIDAPSVTGITPSNGSSYNNTQNIEINATVSDIPSSSLTVVAMIVNGTNPFNLSMTLIAGEWTCDWSNTSQYAADYYNITIWTQDESGNINQTESIVISISDVIGPSVNITYPNDGDTIDNMAHIDINVTITDPSGVSSAKAMITYTTHFNITMQYILGTWTCTWDNTSVYNESDHSITIWTIDSEGNINQTEFIIISRQDLVKPIITFNNPTNNSYITNIFNITVDIDDTNEPLDGNVYATISNSSISFNITLFHIGTIGTTSTWTVEWTNLTTEYAFGDYFINVTAIDDSINLNIHTTSLFNISFVDDDIPPTFTDPGLDDMVIGGTSYTIEIDIDDNISPSGDLEVILELIINPSLFNASMTFSGIGTTWNYIWTNISSFANGNYQFLIRARDASQNGTWSSFTINFSISIGVGPGGFDLIGFLLSPIGLIMIGGIAVTIIAITVVIRRKGGHKASDMEKVRIGRLMGESLCEKCEFYDTEATFCNKLLIVKRYNLNAPCKDFKFLKPEVEGKIEDIEDQVVDIEIIEGSPCNTCQYMNMKTGLCDKYMRYKQLKPETFCKGYKKPKEEKVKTKEKKLSLVKILGPQLCAACQHYDRESGFCNKFLTYKKLKSTESCKSYKKSRVEDEVALESVKEETVFKKEKVASDKLLGSQLCAACQFYDGESGFCNKLLSFKKLKPTESCKSYKKKQGSTESEEQGEVVSKRLIGPQLCAVCQHHDHDTGFCDKFLTYKKLKPKDKCKSFKK